jgi:hypothetical protein
VSRAHDLVVQKVKNTMRDWGGGEGGEGGGMRAQIGVNCGVHRSAEKGQLRRKKRRENLPGQNFEN